MNERERGDSDRGGEKRILEEVIRNGLDSFVKKRKKKYDQWLGR